MTITDDPNEDAALLDDDALIAAYLDIDPHAKDPAGRDQMPDWPVVAFRQVTLPVDVETLAWFRTNYADWQREIGYVLSLRLDFGPFTRRSKPYRSRC